jgi:hypothetical protein
MTLYILNAYQGVIYGAQKFVDGNFQISFLFDPANSDYQNFKTEINDDQAQLKDVDGNVMTSDAAKAYVATLP